MNTFEYNFEKLNKALSENSIATEKALCEYFFAKSDKGSLRTIKNAQEYSLLGAGKRIRPFLVNEVSSVLGGNLEASMPFAIAVEMIHTYSLIHDDLPCMDDDDMRRGKPSNHKVFGEAQAVLAGDALLTNAFAAASANPSLSPKSTVEAIMMISDAAGDLGMIGGQIIDIEGEGRELSFDELLELHTLKTGKMIELSAALGCISAGFGRDTREFYHICEYSKKIGLVFQIIDDILDVVGDEKVVGKTLSSDKENQKTTFLTFFSLNEAKEYAKKLTEEAIAELESIDNSDALKTLAYYLLNRTK